MNANNQFSGYIERTFKSMMVKPNRMGEEWLGITYPYLLQNRLCLFIWRKIFCPGGFHLFDEVQSVEHHYLSCDACDYAVNLATSNEIPE